MTEKYDWEAIERRKQELQLKFIRSLSKPKKKKQQPRKRTKTTLVIDADISGQEITTRTPRKEKNEMDFSSDCGWTDY